MKDFPKLKTPNDGKPKLDFEVKITFTPKFKFKDFEIKGFFKKILKKIKWL